MKRECYKKAKKEQYKLVKKAVIVYLLLFALLIGVCVYVML
jgi:hypothetical protein